MLAVSGISVFKKNEPKATQISFKAVRISDAQTLVGNFLDLTSDRAILKLTNAAEKSSEPNIFTQILQVIETSKTTVMNACKKVLNIEDIGYMSDFDVPKKMSVVIKEMAAKNNHDEALKEFMKDISIPADQLAEDAEPILKKSSYEISMAKDKTKKDTPKEPISLYDIALSAGKKKKPTPKEPKHVEKLTKKTIKDLAAEGTESLEKKKRLQNTDNMKLTREQKLIKIGKEIRLIEKIIGENTVIIDKYWLELKDLNKAKKDNEALDELKELYLQKGIAEDMIKTLKAELNILKKKESRLK